MENISVGVGEEEVHREQQRKQMHIKLPRVYTFDTKKTYCTDLLSPNNKRLATHR